MPKQKKNQGSGQKVIRPPREFATSYCIEVNIHILCTSHINNYVTININRVYFNILNKKALSVCL